MARKAIILGWINQGNTPQCGETVKNQHIVSQLHKAGIKTIQLDFYRWKKRPWVLLKTLSSLLFNPKTPLILSSAPKNIYPLIKLHKFIKSKRNIIHWVIGGNLHVLLDDGTFKASFLNSVKTTIVENPSMLHSLKSQGVDNAIHLPNFKPIDYIPAIPQKNEKIKFVFLSRIKPEKGIDLLIEAIDILNAEGLQDKYQVDLYGRIDEDYKTKFLNATSSRENVNYLGFLNLSTSDGYDKLAQYDAMLFPTHWISEGFAGIFIDAFISGLPVIATDWAHNANIITHGKTGLIFPPKSAHSIAEVMRDCINGKIDLYQMRANCQNEAMKYDIDNVVTPDLLKKIGLL